MTPQTPQQAAEEYALKNCPECTTNKGFRTCICHHLDPAFLSGVEWQKAQIEQEFESDKVNFFLSNIMRHLSTEQMVALRDCLIERTPKVQEGEELAQLRQWKKEALEVMPDFQKIGKLIGVPLGESVHDKIIPYLESTPRPVSPWVRASEDSLKETPERTVLIRWDGHDFMLGIRKNIIELIENGWDVVEYIDISLLPNPNPQP